MSDPSLFPTGPRGPAGPDGRPARIGRGPAAGGQADARADAGGGRATGGRNPFDVEGAMARLKTLLAFDGPNGPRGNVPARGFYLNILT